MENLYTLNNLIAELNTALKINTMHLRAAVKHNDFNTQSKLMFARQELFKSIAHQQGKVIRIYEDALMSNVKTLNRKVA